jgi:hypothetical protein
MKRDRAHALKELAQIHPQYALALSGINPRPLPPTRRTDTAVRPIPYLSFIVAIAFLLFAIYSFSIFISLSATSDMVVHEHADWNLIKALTCFAISGGVAWFGYAVYYENKPDDVKPIEQQPHIMGTSKAELKLAALDMVFNFRLEFDMPTSQEGASNYGPFVRRYDAVIEDYFQSLSERYLQSVERGGNVPSPTQLFSLIDLDEIEYRLVPYFGELAYEHQIQVFRFRTFVKLLQPAPPPSTQTTSQEPTLQERRRRGFIGSQS